MRLKMKRSLLSPFSPRFVAAFVFGVTVVSLVTAGREVSARLESLRRVEWDRAVREAARVAPDLGALLAAGNIRGQRELLERSILQSGAIGAVSVDVKDDRATPTSGMPAALVERAREAAQVAAGKPRTEYLKAGALDVQLTTHAISRAGVPMGTLVLARDTSIIASARWAFWRGAIFGLVVQVLAIVALTLLLLRWSLAAPMAHWTRWMRDMRVGSAHQQPVPLAAGIFQPLAREVAQLASSLHVARASAREEARLRDAAESRWTPDRLRVHVRSKLGQRPLFVISNREPYIHMRENGSIKTLQPASGLVTALEPILLACDGTWIAHGSGDADRATVDADNRLRVPQDQPEYTLRRVWLTQQDEDGYYYGFSNEGLWPLCHIAHTRPVFRAADWASYQRVNHKFAQAALEEMEGTESPIVLVQDYHFALLPGLIKAARPDAQIAVFWHIPWPNPEAFGICPWQGELLNGLLSADLVGFHTQAHCNNFLDTVDRALESQIDWEDFTVRRHKHLTQVRPFPISVACAEGPAPNADALTQPELREALLAELGVSSSYLGVGVDRVDYTKGIVERFHGIERFLETRSDYVGHFTFAQIAAPSRSRIQRYHDLEVEITNEANRINRRFETASWRPIVLLRRHHDHKEITRYYRAADLCFVTSLHDGMNLVAKEFVAAREDDDGVLILSRFAGASGELRDALIVNPYDTDELASALHRALVMPEAERIARMTRMRRAVRENNVYRWAGTLTSTLASISPQA
ncbi:MAG: trehalose-6-phosphate synthase [Vicinamibacterales bacterium]